MKREKIYCMTDSLEGILKEVRKDKNIKALIQINKALDFYIEQYKEITKKTGNISTVQSYHVELDKQIEIKKANVPELTKDIKCKMVCSYCCHSNVDISRDEAALIKFIIERDKIVIDMSLLRRQAKNKNMATWGKLNADEKRCVFLSGLGLCMIYEYRPAACRKLLVVTDPELCDLKTINKVGRFVDWHIEVIASAILNGSKCGPLPKMLLKEF